MTRKEAYEFNATYGDGDDTVIDKIYDDFEQERREQADIRNKSKVVYKERAEIEAERKYKVLIKQYQDAHKNLVNENRRLREEEE